MRATYRVLQVVSIMNRGGAETLLMNYYRNLNRDEIQFDFLVHSYEKMDYEDEIIKLGGRIYRTAPIRPWNYCQYFKFLDKFFAEHGAEYVAVHGHIQENTGFALKYAAKYGIKNRLSHSHISVTQIDYKYPFRLYANRYLKKYVTHRLACGIDAGNYLYGKEPFDVLNNAIKFEDFHYDESKRIKIRAEFGLADSQLVIGNVARFGSQKNHTFLIDIFSQLHSQRPDSVLLLIGEGSLKSSIQKKCDDLGLTNSVKFLGLRGDVNNILQGVDVFVFPSLYEGLPVSVIEAQASGLPCLLSDTIDTTVKVTPNVEFYSLNHSAAEWANQIVKMAQNPHSDTEKCIISAGYNVTENIKKLVSYYTQS